jgi:hypothetical protein
MSLTRISRDVATIVLSSAGQESSSPHSIRLSPRGGDNVVLKGNQIHPITLKTIKVTPATYPRRAIGGKAVKGSAGSHRRDGT